MDATADELIRTKYQSLQPIMDERMRRHWAAAEAMALGRGGVSRVSRATGLARNTIASGVAELSRRSAGSADASTPRQRKPGGGRKSATVVHPGIEQALDQLVDPVTRGHPECPLRWTCKSTRALAAELDRAGHPVSERTVARLLHAAGYSLQANRKTREGASHPDRDAQFRYIHRRVLAAQRAGQPVVSVDTKKKELVGEYRNAGREWHPQGRPPEVNVHDFPGQAMGKAIPYGVYDVTTNEGWVSVGVTHDTAEFAAASLRRWWAEMGVARFPRARELTIMADGGGSNSSRNRLWKVCLQQVADETGMTLRVCHFPPGTSKWNKIEHRLFCRITRNWRGRPLTSYEVIVELIANTRTSTGLAVRAALDSAMYERGKKVSDEELSRVRITPSRFHGEWNYVIRPMVRLA